MWTGIGTVPVNADESRRRQEANQLSHAVQWVIVGNLGWLGWRVHVTDGQLNE